MGLKYPKKYLSLQSSGSATRASRRASDLIQCNKMVRATNA